MNGTYPAEIRRAANHSPVIRFQIQRVRVGPLATQYWVRFEHGG
jgi:hypothetical protein